MDDNALLIFKLVRIVNLTARPFAERVGEAHQLTLNEWRVMALVGANPGCTASQISEHSGLDKMAVSRALSELEHAHRLKREDDPADQRRARLHLSPAGQEVYAVALSHAREREAELLRDMTAKERDALGAMLDKLIASVRHSDERPG